MKQITGAKIVTANGVLENKVLIFDSRFAEIADRPREDCQIIDRTGKYIIPGLIDMHIHGYNGHDISDGTVQAYESVTFGILKNGVTAYLPTTLTVSYKELEASFDIARKLQNKQKTDADYSMKGADILGVHAEGPFINMEKKGAQNPDHIKLPDAEFVIKHRDIIKQLTIAPETDKDFSVIKRLKAETDILLSIGHSSADYDTAVKAIECGISHATHLFNAMSPLTHRAPGVAGAALFSDKVSCELICDKIHVHPAWFKPAFQLKGAKLNLITDCLRACGLPNGTYDSGGLVFIMNGNECRLPDGTIAGSTLKLNEGVRNLANSGVPFHEAVNCASLYPARELGIDNERGQIKEGLMADFSVCDENVNISEVYKRGTLCVKN